MSNKNDYSLGALQDKHADSFKEFFGGNIENSKAYIQSAFKAAAQEIVDNYPVNEDHYKFMVRWGLFTSAMFAFASPLGSVLVMGITLNQFTKYRENADLNVRANKVLLSMENPQTDIRKISDERLYANAEGKLLKELKARKKGSMARKATKLNLQLT